MRWFVLLLLLVALGVFFRNPLFAGGVFHRFDLSLVYLPIQSHHADARASLDLPPWNPHLYLGYPAAAEGECGPLYPPAIVFNLIPDLGVAYTCFILFHYLLGMAAMLYLGSVVGISWVGRGAAALVFVLGGSFVAQTVNLPLVTTIAWIPLILALLLRAFERESYLYSLIAGVTFGIQLLGAHYQMAFYTVVMIGALGLGAVWRNWGVRRVSFVVSASLVTGVVGLGLAAVQLATTAELLFQTERTGLAQAFKMSYSLAPVQLGQFLVPGMLGERDNYIGPWNIYETRFYFGMLTLPFLLLGVAASRNKARSFLWFFVASLVLAMGKYGGIYYLVAELPGFAQTRGAARLTLIASLAAGILVGLGVDRFVQRDVLRGPLSRFIVSAYAIGATGLLVLALFFMASDAGSLWGYSARHASATVAAIRSARHAVLLAAGLALGSGVVWWFARRWLVNRWPMKKCACLFLLLITVDLCLVNGGLHHFADREFYDPRAHAAKSPIVAHLRAQPGLWRVHTPRVELGDPDPARLGGNLAVLFGLHSFNHFLSTLPVGLGEYQQRPLTLKELAVFNVRYLITPRPLASTEVRARDAKGVLVEVPNWLPRVGIREEFVIVSNLTEVQAQIQRSAFDPLRSVILDRQPHYSSGETRQPAAPASVSVLQYEDRTVRLAVSMVRRGIVVLSDMYYPGWEATCDGKPVPILRANGLVRGVALGPGHHSLTFRYRPRSFRIGLSITATAFALILAFLALMLRNRVRGD